MSALSMARHYTCHCKYLATDKQQSPHEWAKCDLNFIWYAINVGKQNMKKKTFKNMLQKMSLQCGWTLNKTSKRFQCNWVSVLG